METNKPPSNKPSVQQGYGLLAGGMLLVFFSCLGAITADVNGPLVFVMGSFFVIGIVITLVAIVQAVKRKR